MNNDFPVWGKKNEPAEPKPEPDYPVWKKVDKSGEQEKQTSFSEEPAKKVFIENPKPFSFPPS